ARTRGENRQRENQRGARRRAKAAGPVGRMETRARRGHGGNVAIPPEASSRWRRLERWSALPPTRERARGGARCPQRAFHAETCPRWSGLPPSRFVRRPLDPAAWGQAAPPRKKRVGGNALHRFGPFRLSGSSIGSPPKRPRRLRRELRGARVEVLGVGIVVLIPHEENLVARPHDPLEARVQAELTRLVVVLRERVERELGREGEVD